jgi:hypothetical protein
LYGEGLELPVKMEYDTTLAEQSYKLAARWDAARTTDASKLNFKESDLDGFDSNQISMSSVCLVDFEPVNKKPLPSRLFGTPTIVSPASRTTCSASGDSI